jgi:fibronectin type 3 domain-containing protein
LKKFIFIVVLLLLACGDAIPPGSPYSLSLDVSSDQITITWSEASSVNTIINYEVYRDGVLIAIVEETSYTDTDISPDTVYCYCVLTVDEHGTESKRSDEVCVTTESGVPTMPADISATAASDSEIDVIWTASTDDVGLAGYYVYRDGSLINTAADASYTDTGLAPETNCCYQVSAYDDDGNESGKSTEACATTNADETPPDVPASLVANAISSSEIELTWEEPTDNVGVVGYNIYYDDSVFINSAADISYSDTGLTNATSYCYQVTAYDAQGNESDGSIAACETTFE